MRSFFMILAVLVLLGCQPQGDESVSLTYRSDLANLKLPEPRFDYTPQLPAHFTDPTNSNYRFVGAYDNMPDDNVTTDAGATLGRVLFYDTRLSANETVSCASCHKQENGFSDDETFSEGFQNGMTRRHSMGLANARFYPNGRFFWDERAPTLEEQVLMPIQDPVEMGMDLTTLLGILNATQEYPVLFDEAFGTQEITEERLAKALAQFVRSMISYQSKFDVAIEKGLDHLTPAELSGAKLFTGFCQGCHKGPMQNGTEATVNGIDDISTVVDLGLAEVTGLETDEGKFKTPSLRNIAVTAPYMHDGRFTTLDQVLTQYFTNVQNHVNLDNRLKSSGQPIRIPLSRKQKDEILLFFDTLTDHEFLSDEKFADPFL